MVEDKPLNVDHTELSNYTREFRDAVLQGSSSEWMCVALSAPLHAAFQARGIPSQLVVSDLGFCDHIFLRLPDGQVLDPTADQFNWCSLQKLPGVYLGPPAAIHEGAQPWAGRSQDWHELVASLKRLYPTLDAADVGRTVSITLRTLPPGLCEFTPTERCLSKLNRPGAVAPETDV
jgi:hypothetical protein